MERKTKHRIIGVVVVIALVIILLPLFQGKEIPPKEALLKAPPFPEQPVQVSSNAVDDAHPIPIQNITPIDDSGINQQPDDVIRNVHPTIVNTPAEVNKPVNNAIQTNTAPVKQETVAITNVAQPSVASAPQAAQPNNQTIEDKTNLSNTRTLAAQETVSTSTEPPKEVLQPVIPVIHQEEDEDVSQPAVKITQQMKKTAKTAPQLVSVETSKKAAVKTPFVPVIKPYVPDSYAANNKTSDNDGLIRLKNAAWVIQMGSFKNKANAVRLANQLRANGYKAFIQQIADNTRVYVGPENKQTFARQLASKLESNLHIKGIVISYQPLTL